MSDGEIKEQRQDVVLAQLRPVLSNVSQDLLSGFSQRGRSLEQVDQQLEVDLST
ncbi:MAG: hypothetical protein IIC87_05000 [Chloroflexi bacterium]|nr:hypothetical protein [Chloroflexota bacterium]